MCIVSFKTMTAAQHAKYSLASSGIPCEVVNIDPNLTKRGCSYGLELSNNNRERAIRVLNYKGISYGEVYG